MPFRFNESKAVQIIAQLLKHAGGSDDYLRVVKLFYIADRRCIQKAAYPIAGGPVIALEHGPVASGVFDMVKTASKVGNLLRPFEIHDHKLCLFTDPGVGKLCQFNIDLIKDLCTEYFDKGGWEVAEETREFDEWKQNWREEAVPPVTIPYKDIFEAVGMSHAYEHAASEEEIYNAEDDFFEKYRGCAELDSEASG